MDPKLEGALPPFWAGEGVPIEHKVAWAETYLPSGFLVHTAVWPQRTLAENWGGCAPLGKGAGFPSNTMSPRPWPTPVPNSGILIHTEVWPQ